MKMCIIENYNNDVMPHGSILHKTIKNMVRATTCPFPPKCVFLCCANCKNFGVPGIYSTSI